MEEFYEVKWTKILLNCDFRFQSVSEDISYFVCTSTKSGAIKMHGGLQITGNDVSSTVSHTECISRDFKIDKPQNETFVKCEIHMN